MAEKVGKNTRHLKSGYTTGTCATLAAKAATTMLFVNEPRTTESVIVPKGVKILANVEDIKRESNKLSCAVRKYSGDDPDVTNGLLIYAEVELIESPEVIVEGGKGVGRVTKPGLQQEIGEAAINKVPKQMIQQVVAEVLEKQGYAGGAKVTITVPGGEEIAKKTFNPRLGIVGGISIVGTSGIVEPMSEKALIDTILVEMKVLKASGLEYIMITPGNYGADFIKEQLKIDLNKAVRCSNFVGEAIDFAQDVGFKGILLIGHVGKFIKLAAGIMNTHSKQADGRMEVIAVHAALEGASTEILEKIMACISTDEAIKYLQEAGIFEGTMARITKRIATYVGHRSGEDLEVGVIFFSNIYGILGQTSKVDELLEHLKEEKERKEI